MANQAQVWDGNQWVPTALTSWSSGQWQTGPPLYWDGAEWRAAAPTPVEYPQYAGGISRTCSMRDVVSLPLPTGTRTNDFVVSICAQSDGPERWPRLLAPNSIIPTAHNLANSGIRLYVAVWPWEPSKGHQVVWDVAEADSVALMNLTYRGGDVSNASLTPVTSITEYSRTNTVPLGVSVDYTTLYAVLTVTATLTGAGWPDGVIPRQQQLGTFGERSIALLTADTPGGGSAPGSLQLDATVDAAVSVLITVPGRSDGHPTWILGDQSNSVLGSTTYLG